MRAFKQANNEPRPLEIIRNYTKFAPGSVLISFGNTRVLCTATIEEKVPPFLRDSGQGWVTAEYSMLPGATQTRTQREVTKGKPSGRTTEIQRLIGRALRSVIDLKKLGERTIYIDADVIQADGGTRTAAITGGMVAMYDALRNLRSKGTLKKNPVKEFLGALSVGIVNGEVLLDLCYEEDCNADVDMNVIMTESGRFVEIQGTAEKEPFTQKQLTEMLSYAEKGILKTINYVKEKLDPDILFSV